MLFTGCSDDNDDNDDNKGLGKSYKLELKNSEITDAPGNDEINTVKLITYKAANSHILASTSWSNGFTLEFPETVPSVALEQIEEFFEFEDEEIGKGITISDHTAKLCYGWLEGYKGDVYVNDFEFGFISASQYVEIYYVYSDKAVKVTGSCIYEGESYKDTENYNISLQAGWNQMAKITKPVNEREETTNFTTSIPSGAKWIFGYWD